MLQRPSWGIARKGDQIAVATQSGFGSSQNVAMLPSGAWTLFPLQYGWQWEIIPTDPFFIITLLVAIATNYIREALLQKPPNLPGIVIGSGANPSPFQAFLKVDVPAGQSWANELPDAQAFHKVTPPTQFVPMQRVLVGKVTYPENQGFCFRFYIPGTKFQATDTITTFYFGGPTDVFPATQPNGTPNKGGQFAAAFRGDGTAILYEACGAQGDPSGFAWKQVMSFRYAPQGQVANKVHTVFFVPHKSDRMDIFCETADVSSVMGQTQGPRKTSTVHAMNTTGYFHNVLVTGVNAKRAMTGPGVVRMDGRADLRLQFQISYLLYPPEGFIEDHNFQIPFPLPAGTPLQLTFKSYQPDGTSIIGKLHNSVTRAELQEDPQKPGTFLSEDGVSSYYVRFKLTANDRKKTPVLYAFHVYAPGVSKPRPGEEWEGGFPTRISITGPTSDPTQESAQVVVEDPAHQAERLLHRGRIHTQIRTTYDQGDLSKFAVLMEGEVTRANGLRKGRPGKAWPNPLARTYDFPMVSMWARNNDQLWMGQMKDFSEDPDSDEDPTNGNYRKPYKITEIVRTIFSEALGYPQEMLDIPDLDFRAFISAKDPMEYVLQPTASIMDYLQKLVKDHLGYFLLWDANAGSQGMWRLRPPTLQGAAPLWNFTTSGPAGFPTAAVHPGAYPPRTSPIYHYSSQPRPPEANYIVVTTVGQIFPGKRASYSLTQFAFNQASFSDPTHPDFLGRFVPLVYFNANLGTSTDEQENERIINWVTRRLYNQVATAQKWIHLTAPLVLLDDPSDTHLSAGKGRRPLRYYDPITVNNIPCYVHSVEMNIEEDPHQMMTIECLAQDNTEVV